MSMPTDNFLINTQGSSATSDTSTRQSSDTYDDASSATSTSHPGQRRRIKSISQKLKSKAIKVLHIDDTEEHIQARQDGVFDEIQGNPAFNPQSIFNEKSMTVSGMLDQTAGTIRKAGFTIAHPKSFAKRKAAAKLATPEQPFLSHEVDKVLLEAHERLQEAQENASSGGEDDCEKWEETIHGIESQRESLRVAWTTSRYVHRVRVVPKEPHVCPRLEDFRIYDQQGRYVRTDWIKYWAYYVLYATQERMVHSVDPDYPPFNRDILVEYLERILMASAPWQSYFLNLRKIWRWEDPKKTGRWFAIFSVVWLIDYVITFCLCYVVCIVISNRYRSRSVEGLRESHERALDQGATAFKIGELIHRHGAGHWIDPVVNEVGPRAQLQLHDFADFLEMLQNFYDWKFPRKTLATLFTFCMGITLGALTPVGYTMRAITFVLIMWFFTGRPIASYHPHFRHVVSPIAYVFWGNPTHAQWSFDYLRVKAQTIRQRVIQRAVETSGTEDRYTPGTVSDIGASVENGAPHEDTIRIENAPHVMNGNGNDREELFAVESPPSKELYFLAFRCRYHGLPGRLTISPHGICFVRLFPKKEIWRRSFVELVEMRKETGSPIVKGLGKILEDHQLVFVFADSNVDQVDAMRNRDEAFNSIIGFSGLQWETLEPL